MQFHGVCKGVNGDKTGNDTISSRSFYNTFDKTATSTVYQQRPGNICFVCDHCMTSFEQKRAADQESKVDVISSRVDNLSRGMEEMKSMMSTFITSQKQELPVAASSTSPLFADIANPGFKRSVLVLNDQDNKTSSFDSVKQIITDKSIHVDKTYVNKKGETVFVFPTENDREKLYTEVKSAHPTVKTHLKPADRLPTISIANLSQQYSEESLTQQILHSHPDIKQLAGQQSECFLVLNVKRQIKNPDKYQATVRVSDSIRKVIENYHNRVYIGAESCKVYDHFHVKRCNKCQKYNHYAAECKATSPVCGHCAGDHQSNECKVDSRDLIPCCSNCKNSKGVDSSKHTHKAFDRSCPSYMIEQKKLMGNINYYRSSKN